MSTPPQPSQTTAPQGQFVPGPSGGSSNVPMTMITPEQIKSVVAAAQALKQRGATEETDPEFARLMTILRHVNMFSKQQQHQRATAAASSAQRPSAPSSNVPVNGHQPTTNPETNLSEENVVKFTPSQLTALRCQIHAFKLISANQPIPGTLQKIVFDPSSVKNAEEVGRKVGVPVTEANAIAASSVPNKKPTGKLGIAHKIAEETLTKKGQDAPLRSADSSSDPTSPPQPTVPLPPQIVTQQGQFSSPFSFFERRVYAPDQTQRVLLPSALPFTIDPVTLTKERERFVKARIAYRIKELETLKSNLATQNSDVKLKALIELKALKLFEKQKQVRRDLLQAVSKATTLATAVDRTSFRRMKKLTLREARQTEKHERAQRSERERREQQKHTDYMASVMVHSKEFYAFHRAAQSKNVRLGSAVLRYHANAAKEEEKRLQRMAQERLDALKANDEEAYLKLLDKTKDTRITHLLEQTDKFLGSLTVAMEKQKSSVGADLDVMAPSMAASSSSAGGEDGETIDYFDSAHRIKEVVTEQPSILIGGTLKEYQLKGLQWMVSLYNNRLNGILADEMGLGKTIQTLSLITYLIEKKKQPGPYLVIVPLSTITNWTLEFEKWAPSVVKIVYKGSPTERKSLQALVRAGNFNVLLTTYEYIINPKDRPTLCKVKWLHMIIDEGHRMKNSNSRLSVTLMQYYTSRYRLILTGTPLQNNLPELWALLNFILPKIFNSVKSFDEWFNSPFANSVGQEKIELTEEEQLLVIRRLHKVLRPFLLRRLKKDVESELPDKVETVIKCPMSALQHRLYDQVRNKRFGAEAFAKKKALNNLVMQFRKICNHPYVFDEVEETINPAKLTDENLFRVAGKFELLDRILPKYKASGHRVLIFFQMTQVMDIMEDFLRWRGYTYLRLDGSTKAEDRTSMLKVFNRSEDPPFLFLLSTRAGGLGLNLQTADTVIIYDSDWNPHQDLQAQDRAHRIGQKNEVRILRLVTAKSVEENILARAQYKLDIDGKVIQAGKFDHKTTDREREELLRSLFGGDEDEDDGEEKAPEGEMDDNELNEIIARDDNELELFSKMDKERKEREAQQWKARGGRGPPPPRLMQDSELPAVYLQDYSNPAGGAKDEDLIIGRGARARKDVAYDDGLNEDQWLDAVDQGDVEGFIAKKRAQKLKREERKRKRLEKKQAREAAGEVGTDDEEDDEEDEEGDEEHERYGRGAALKDPTRDDDDIDSVGTATPAKKRGRGRPPTKRDRAETVEADEVMEDGQDNEEDEDGHAKKKRKRGRPPKQSIGRGRSKPPAEEPDSEHEETLDPATRAALTRVCKHAYRAIEECEVEESGYTRRRCELFLMLPDRTQYQDYYRIITRPIAMDRIQSRIQNHYYQTVQSFVGDFHLMFSNAMTYNLEGSDVWLDAKTMKEVFDSTIAELCPGGQVPVLPEDHATASSGASRKRIRQVSDEEDGADDGDDAPAHKPLPRISLKLKAPVVASLGQDDEEDEEDD